MSMAKSTCNAWEIIEQLLYLGLFLTVARLGEIITVLLNVFGYWMTRQRVSLSTPGYILASGIGCSSFELYVSEYETPHRLVIVYTLSFTSLPMQLLPLDDDSEILLGIGMEVMVV
eukprot:3586482-Karenia_brevis.AAC.1